MYLETFKYSILRFAIRCIKPQEFSMIQIQINSEYFKFESQAIVED